jgi:hypothetical protein
LKIDTALAGGRSEHVDRESDRPAALNPALVRRCLVHPDPDDAALRWRLAANR